jgi:hypothetical protein
MGLSQVDIKHAPSDEIARNTWCGVAGGGAIAVFGAVFGSTDAGSVPGIEAGRAESGPGPNRDHS